MNFLTVFYQVSVREKMYMLHITTKLGIIFVCLGLLFSGMTFGVSPDEQARDIIKATGISGGLIVHLGCGDGKLTAALRLNNHYVVHGLDRERYNVAKARDYIQGLGIYGGVSVDRLADNNLPYIDNLINLMVAEDFEGIAEAEMMRVLVPEGVAYIKNGDEWERIVKSRSEEIDDWTHYLHGADGNPVAEDLVVGPPKHFQWISGPLWLRSHESDSSVKALVTAGGRLFYINDEAPISLVGQYSPPDKWFLTARDAFNGILLWQVPIENWGWRSWKPSWFTPRPGGIPLNMPKRLVATEEKVYVTLGYRAGVSELDGRTGKIIKTYKGTEHTTEILLQGETLILTVLEGDRDRVLAVDCESGKTLWKSENSYGGTITDYYRFRAMYGSVPPAKVDPTLNTATDGKVVALLDGGDVVCLDFKTGKEKWRRGFPLVKADYKAGNINAMQTVWTGTLIAKDGVVVHASPNQMAGFSAASGEILWKQAKKYLQHLWFEWKDVFVIDSLVWTWSAELEKSQLEGRKLWSVWPATVNGYDLHTGEIKKKIDLGNIFKTFHHHRCYRNKATVNYILASRRGTEYVDLKGGNHTVQNWVRGTCHLGMMPANGLQYAPPHPCVCYIEEKLNGFLALAPAEKPNDEIKQTLRLEHRTENKIEGPAAGEEDWPVFRNDGLRSGFVKTKISAKVKLLWQKKTGGKSGAPIVVGEQLFVPLVDEYSILCLNSLDGAKQWRFTAGGRIDSAPSYYQGAVLFGCADGWMYCVRAKDGKLVWRFRAAPAERLIGAFGRLESAWPVHGSILVQDGIAYAAAGRSSQLDGGIYLYGLDVGTGEVRYAKNLEGPDYNVNNISQNFELPMGAVPDILQSDGEFIYMKNRVFNKKLELQKPTEQPTAGRLHSFASLLDESFFKRAPWLFGKQDAYGRQAVHDEECVYFVRMFDSLRALDPNVYFTPGKKGYLLYAVRKEGGKAIWRERMVIRGNAMIATEEKVFVGGYPDVVDAKDPLGAFEGRKGGVLAVYNKADGKKLGQWELSAPPVLHGLAGARGGLYLVMQDGTVAYFGK